MYIWKTEKSKSLSHFISGTVKARLVIWSVNIDFLYCFLGGVPAVLAGYKAVKSSDLKCCC